MAEITNIIDKGAIEDIMKCNTSLLETDKVLQGLLTTVGSYQKAVDNVTKSNADAGTKSSEYAKLLNKAAEEQNKFTATTKELQKQQKQLTDTEAKLNTVHTEANRKLQENKIKLQEANAALKENITGTKAAAAAAKQKEKEDKAAAKAAADAAKAETLKNKPTKEQIELLKIENVLNNKNAGTLEKAIAANKKLDIEKRKLNQTTTEGKKRLAEIIAEENKNNNTIRESSNQLQKQKINIGNYGSAFKGLATQFRSGEIGVKGLIKGVMQLGKQLMITIVTNPILLVIALIVGAVVALYKAFKSTDSGATLLAAKFEQLKAILDVVRQVAAGVANAIVSIFKGDRDKAAEQFGDAIKNVKERMIEAAKAAQEYTYELDRIEDSEANYISRSAEIKNQIAKLEYTAQDRTKSTAERRKALEEALALGMEEVETRKKLAEDTFNAEAKYLADKSGVRQDDLKAYLLMTDEEQANASKGLQAARDSHEKEFKNLEELYANMMDADTKFYDENKRNLSRMTGFEEEENEKRLALAKLRIEAGEEATETQREFNADLLQSEKELSEGIVNLDEEMFKELEKDIKEDEKLVKASTEFLIGESEREYQRKVMIINATSKTKEEAARRIMDLDLATMQNDIDLMRWSLENTQLTEEQKFQIKNDLANAELELDKLKSEKEIENAEDVARRKKDLQQAIYDSSVQLANGLFDFNSQLIKNEMTLLEQKNERGELSDKEYAKQKAEIQIKQAKADKAQGLFNVAISTYQAVMKALADPGGVAGTILAIAAGVMGGLQAAAILSEPLPQMPTFAKGTKNAPRTFIAGEAGRELLNLRTGEMLMATGPTVFSGEKFKGAHIMSNPETERYMSATSHSGFSRSDQNLTNEIRQLNKTIKDKPVFIFDQNQRVVGIRTGSRTAKYINRYKFND
jgi:hypothetical protein